MFLAWKPVYVCEVLVEAMGAAQIFTAMNIRKHPLVQQMCMPCVHKAFARPNVIGRQPKIFLSQYSAVPARLLG